MQRNSSCIFTPTTRSLLMKTHSVVKSEATWDIWEVTSWDQYLIFTNKKKECHNLSVPYTINLKFLVSRLLETSKYTLRIMRHLCLNCMEQRTNLSISKISININKMLTVKRLLDLSTRSPNGMNNTKFILWISRDEEKSGQSKTWLWSKKKIHKSI